MKSKIIIYQLLPRIFSNINDTNTPWGDIEENGCGKLNEFKDTAIESLKGLGINCIWLTGIIRHASTTNYSQYKIKKDNPLIVKGRAGSPYAITDYFDIDPDLAIDVDNRMKEFVELVERIHRHGIKVIIDFVPNHVARNYNIAPNYGKNYISSIKHHLGANEDNSKTFEISNNFYYIPCEAFEVPSQAYDKLTNFMSRDEIYEYSEFPAKATGNNCFSAKPSVNDWYETVKLNYGIDYRDNSEFFDPIPNTWLCMNDILNFWAEKGVDGFRCDMAEMVPYQYWKWQIHQIKSKYPEMIFIAEIYKRDLYDLFLNEAKFDFLYDKVDMYDSLKDIITGKSKVNKITESWQKTNNYNDKMLRFMENHDEQRIASDLFTDNPFKALPACIVSAFLHNGPFMIYNCQELGEKAEGISGFSGNDGRTTIFDYWSIDCQRRWNNEGKFDEEKLTEKEISLRNKYSIILQEAASEIVILQGKLYDLMWINQHLIDLNCYAFIKTYEFRHIIYVVNFNENSIEIDLKLNSHVFDFLGLQQDEKIYNIRISGYWYQKLEIK